MSIEYLNEFSHLWSQWIIAGLLGTFLTALIVTLTWLTLRKRCSASLGCWLFLLIAIKLFVPLEIPIPQFMTPHLTPLTKWTVSEQHDTKNFETTEAFEELQEILTISEPITEFALISPLHYEPAQPEILKDEPKTEEANITPFESEESFDHAPVVVDTTPRTPLHWNVWLALGWCVVVLTLFVRFLWNEIRFRRTMALSREVDFSIRELADAMGIRQRVSVRESDRIAIPAVYGVFRPVILVPKQFFETLPKDELRWILLHELAHIKRFDLPMALVLRIASILHFFNPSIWYAASQVRKLREYACDDLALATLQCENVQKTGGSALLRVVEHARSLRAPANEALGAFDFKTSLKTRLRRLLDTRRTIRTKLGLGSVILLLLVAAVALPKLTAQHDAPEKAKTETEIQSVTPQAGETGETLDDLFDEVTGRIVDEWGKPVPRTYVRIIPSPKNRDKIKQLLNENSNFHDKELLHKIQWSQMEIGERTGEDGTFKVQVFKDDDKVTLFLTKRPTNFIKTITKRSDLGDIFLTPGIEPTIRILTPDGQPLPAGWCNFYPVSKDERIENYIGKSKIFFKGYCEFDPFEPGEYTISISKYCNRNRDNNIPTSTPFQIPYVIPEKTVTLSPDSKDFTIKAIDTVTVILRFQGGDVRGIHRWRHFDGPVFTTFSNDKTDLNWSCTWNGGDAMGDGVFRFRVPKNVPLKFLLPKNENSLYRLQLPGEQTSEILYDVDSSRFFSDVPIYAQATRSAMKTIPSLHNDCEFKIIPVKPAQVTVRAVDENGQAIQNFRVIPGYFSGDSIDPSQEEINGVKNLLQDHDTIKGFPRVYWPQGISVLHEDNEATVTRIHPEENLRLLAVDTQGRHASADVKLKEGEEKQITVTLKNDTIKNNVTISQEKPQTKIAAEKRETVAVTVRYQDVMGHGDYNVILKSVAFSTVSDDKTDSSWNCKWYEGYPEEKLYQFQVPKNVPLRFSLPIIAKKDPFLYRLQLPGEETSKALYNVSRPMDVTAKSTEIDPAFLPAMRVIPYLKNDCEFKIIPVKAAQVSVRAVDENGQTITAFRVLPRYRSPVAPDGSQEKIDPLFTQEDKDRWKAEAQDDTKNTHYTVAPYELEVVHGENEVSVKKIHPEEDLCLLVVDAQGRHACVGLKLKEGEEEQITVTLKNDTIKNNVTVSPEKPVSGVPPEITVTITDENLNPMKDVLLKVRLVKDRKEFRSDENGKVVVDTKAYQNVETGWFTFEASAPNRVTTLWQWLRRQENPTAIPSQFTIRLEPGYTIGGVVVDEQGNPVAGAKVVPTYEHRAGNMYANEQMPRANWDGVITDAQGQWKAEGYSKNNGQILLSVTHDDFLPSVKNDETSGYLMSDILAGKAKTVLKTGFHVHGTVRDSQGKPAPGAIITFDDPDMSNCPSAQRKTDENGRYDIKSWYKKSTKYSVASPDLAPDFGTLDFDAPKYTQQKEAECDFTLKKGKTIRLKVVDPEGNPIKKFWVCMHSGQPYINNAFSHDPNSEGVWEWHHAPDEYLFFDIDSMKGFDRINGVKMKPQEEPFIVTARGTTVVSGNVIDSETKKTIENFNLIQGMIRTKPLPGYTDESWMRESPIKLTGGFYTLNFDSSPEPEDARVRCNAIRIEAIGYEPEQSKAIDLNGQKQTLNFELKPSKSKPVRAVVLLPDGKPAVDAEVALGGLSGIAVRTRNDRIEGNTGNAVVKTDAKGAFEFPTPGVPYVILAAHSDGFAFARQAEVETGTIRMIPWARIEGTVYKNDKPAPKAAIWGTFDMPSEQLWAFPRSQRYEALVEATANTNGKFVIEKVAPGLSGLMGFKDASAYIRVATESGKTSTVKIVPKSEEEKPIPEVLVPQDVTIHVTDEQGKAIVGAKIGFRHAEDGYGRKQITTDENGIAIYKDMTGKANITSAGLEVYAAGYATDYRNWGRSDGRFDTVPAELKIVLKKGVRLGGKVVDEKGEPIVGARVDVTYPSPTKSYFWERAGRPTTDTEGRWSIDTFPPEITKFSLDITHPKFQSTDQTTKMPTFDELKAESSVIVLKSGQIVNGVVKKEDGTPLEDATVVLWRFPFTGEYRVVNTDKDGKYSLDNWRRTGTFIAAIAVGLAPDSKLLNEKEFQTPIDFTLKPGKTVRLKFVDKNGEPVGGVRVSPFRWRGQSSVLSGGWQTVPEKADAQGNYLWDWAPDDEILYTFFKTGYLAIRDKAIKPSEEVQTITMLRSLVINGTVIDAETQKPVPEFNVIPGVNWGNPNMSGGQIGWRTEKSQQFRDGKFKIVFDEPRDGHHVRVEADGYVPFASEMYKDDQGEVNLSVELRKGENIQGQVLLPDGVTPAVGVEVILGVKGGNSPQFTNGNLDEESRKRYRILRTDAEGRFTVPPLSEPFMLLPFSDVGIARISGKEFQKEPDARTVTLIPWGRIEGKLMIPPIAKSVGMELEIRSLSTRMTQKILHWNQDGEREPDPWYNHTAQPDAEGNFVIPKVLPAEMNFTYSTYRDIDGGILLQTEFVRTPMINIEPGKTVQIQLGEQPCSPVEGKIVLSKTDENRIDWKGATIRLWPNIGAEVSFPGPKFSDEDREKFFDKIEVDGKTSWRMKEGEENQKALQDYHQNWLETDAGKEASQAYTEYREKLKATENRIYQAIPDENGKFRFGGVAPGDYWFSVRFDCPGQTRKESFNRKVFVSPDTRITIDPGSGTVDLGELNVGELRELDQSEQFNWRNKR